MIVIYSSQHLGMSTSGSETNKLLIPTGSFSHSSISVSPQSTSPHFISSNQTLDLLLDTENTIGKIEREREIFLHAALQLLNNTSSSNPNSYIRADSDSDLIEKSSFVDPDVIRYGFMKKMNRSHSFPALKPQLKCKYAELRHGKFMYENTKTVSDTNDHRSLLKSNASNSKRKIIDLDITTCECKAMAHSRANGKYSFGITVNQGPQRVFVCASEVERDAWVQAINISMEGSVNELLGLGFSCVPSLDVDNLSLNDEFSGVATDDNNINTLSSISSEVGMQSWWGPVGLYASEISKFLTAKRALQNAITSSSCCHLLGTFYKRDFDVTIPVLFVKNETKTSDASFALNAKDLTLKSIESVETSQIWKDFQRDAISINGEVIRGDDMGTEAMIGSLMRHIMETVEAIRQKYSSFELTEAQALLCARDILILTNRTQSGGDSYFCVDSLFCNKSRDLSVLAPMSSNTDPICITVELAIDSSQLENSDHRCASGDDHSSSDIESCDNELVIDDCTSTAPNNVSFFKKTFVSPARLSPTLKTISSNDKVNDKKIERLPTISFLQRQKSRFDIASQIFNTKSHEREKVVISTRLPESAEVCLRIEVCVRSRYRLCDSNPQDDNESIWGEIRGDLKQVFLIKSGGVGRMIAGDRVVSISISSINEQQLNM